MTREEAITRLHWLKRELIKGTDMNDPIDMAISALSKADNAENPKCDLLTHEEAWNTIDKENKSADSLLTDSAEADKESECKLDLISRADAVNAVHKYFVDLFNDEPYETDEDGDEVFTDMKSVNALLKHNKAVSKALKALPSADRPTIVRCKDCRWWNSETNGCKRNPSVEAWHETDFCKYGEQLYTHEEVWGIGMTDRIKQCDVVKSCEDCPRYADDCDGEEDE